MGVPEPVVWEDWGTEDPPTACNSIFQPIIQQQGRAGEEGAREVGVPEPVVWGDWGTEDPPPPVIPPFNPPFSLCALGALPENSLIFPMF